jgi:hypothetical protein
MLIFKRIKYSPDSIVIYMALWFPEKAVIDEALQLAMLPTTENKEKKR